MNMKLKVAAAIAASLLGVSTLAGATDIRGVNLSDTAIHPWFRSNCFASMPRGQWVNFGTILAFSQFTWTQFELLLDPACRKPVVEFTYNVGSMLPPLENLPSALVARIRFSDDMGVIGVHVVQAAVVGPSKKDDD